MIVLNLGEMEMSSKAGQSVDVFVFGDMHDKLFNLSLVIILRPVLVHS